MVRCSAAVNDRQKGARFAWLFCRVLSSHMPISTSPCAAETPLLPAPDAFIVQLPQRQDAATVLDRVADTQPQPARQQNRQWPPAPAFLRPDGRRTMAAARCDFCGTHLARTVVKTALVVAPLAMLGLGVGMITQASMQEFNDGERSGGSVVMKAFGISLLACTPVASWVCLFLYINVERPGHVGTSA